MPDQEKVCHECGGEPNHTVDGFYRTSKQVGQEPRDKYLRLTIAWQSCQDHQTEVAHAVGRALTTHGQNDAWADAWVIRIIHGFRCGCIPARETAVENFYDYDYANDLPEWAVG